MWANAQRGERPAEYTWHPLFNAAVSPTPSTRVPCSNAAKKWNPLKLAGVPQTNETTSAASTPKFITYKDIWRRYRCLTSLFLILDTCLSCEDIARQSCGMVPRRRFLRHFCVPYFQRAACSRFQTCILNSHKGHTMCGSMVDIQSLTAEIRRGKKRRNKIEETTGWKYNDLPYSIGWP